MKTITFTSEDLVKKIRQSYNRYKAGFQTQAEHYDYCHAIEILVGKDMYDEVASIIEANPIE